MQEVVVKMAITFPSRLPNGMIHRHMAMLDILATVALNYGLPLRCHPDEPYVNLYTGKTLYESQNNSFFVQAQQQPTAISYNFCIYGTFNRESLRAELVWAFDINKCRQFLIIPQRTYSKIGAHYLWSLAKSFKYRFPDHPLNLSAVEFFLASDILKNFLDRSWCDRQFSAIGTPHPRFNPGTHYQQTRRAMGYAIELAEILFNLQDVSGFENRLKRIVNDNLESIISEFVALRLLARSSLPFRFVTETGCAGADYEADVTLPSGQLACCEVKCKDIKANVTQNSVFNSLDRGSGQVPKDKLGILFLQIPEKWAVENLSLDISMNEAIFRLFRLYKRIIAVIVLWETWHENANGETIFIKKHKEYTNEQSRFYNLNDRHLILSIEGAEFGEPWHSLRDFAVVARA